MMSISRQTSAVLTSHQAWTRSLALSSLLLQSTKNLKQQLQQLQSKVIYNSFRKTNHCLSSAAGKTQQNFSHMIRQHLLIVANARIPRRWKFWRKYFDKTRARCLRASSDPSLLLNFNWTKAKSTSGSGSCAKSRISGMRHNPPSQ